MLALFVLSTLLMIALCIYGLYANWSNSDVLYNVIGFAIVSLCSAFVYGIFKSPTKRKYIIYFMYFLTCLLLGFSIWSVIVGGIEQYWLIGACILQFASIVILHYMQPPSMICCDRLRTCTQSVFRKSPRTRTQTSTVPSANGIWIINMSGDVMRIRELSGPIAFSVLMPPSRRYPPIILMGDRHESYEGMCERRTDGCKADEGCFSLMSPELYKALNDVCPQDEKIDIFSEQSLFREVSESKLSGPLVHLRNISTQLKGKLSSIRWHLADPRFPLFGNKSYLESLFIGINFQVNMSPFDKKNAANVRTILLSLVDPERRIIDLDQYVDTFVDVLQTVNERESIIVKEMRKQTFALSFADLRLMLKTLLYESWSELGDWYFDDTDYEEFVNAVKTYTTPSRSAQYIETRPNYRKWKFYDLFVKAFSFLLDIYTLLRMFKQYASPHEQSALVMGYFGLSHTKRLQHMLTTMYGYDLLIDQHWGNNGERCHIINRPIELFL